jgi:hypothetical protein
MPPGYREFEFDLPQALLAHLVRTFDSVEDAPLTPESVTEIPEAQGVYQLFHQRRLVYIGKTDAEAGLKQRLGRHAWTVQHRRNLDTSEVSFKAVRVFVFTALDLETQMIRHYRCTRPVPWNDSGFGSNDPGKERDTTNAKAEGFDAQFPVDLDRTVPSISSRQRPGSVFWLLCEDGCRILYDLSRKRRRAEKGTPISTPRLSLFHPRRSQLVSCWCMSSWRCLLDGKALSWLGGSSSMSSFASLRLAR